MQVCSSTVYTGLTENHEALHNIRSHAEVFLEAPEMLLKYREND